MEADEDVFEKEMLLELEERAKQAERHAFNLNSEPNSVTTSSTDGDTKGAAEGNVDKDKLKKGKKKVEFYDPVYFDSSDSEGSDEDSKSKKKEKRRVVDDSELFYDSKLDDGDQLWIDQKRRSYCQKQNNGSQSSKLGANAVVPLPNSDAVLNCPACFSLLCLDCQRHDTYSSQYRAMFVVNCKVVSDEELVCPLPEKKKGKKTKRKTTDGVGNTDKEEDKCIESVSTRADDIFHSVKCKLCNTSVAVIDSDEVYHFFNVLASH